MELEFREYDFKILNKSCQIQRFNYRDKNKELVGDEAVQMVIATSNSDWNVYDMTANKWKQSC